MGFGGWSIDETLYKFISLNLGEGKTILEFGSGDATKELAKKWIVYSVEESEEWSGKHHNKYILSPIENQSYTKENGWQGWYNREIVKSNLPTSVDLILVDGPCKGNRNGLFDNKDIILNLGYKIMIFDDIERPKDLKCYNSFLNYYKENSIKIEYEIISSNLTEENAIKKSFGYIKIL